MNRHISNAASLLLVASLLTSCEPPAEPLAPSPPVATASPSASVAAPPAEGPPVAEVKPVTETYFGNTVSDPYRWMEELDAPAMQRYLKAQADYARKKLDALPARKAILDRITALDQGESLVYDTRRAGGKLFYQKVPPGADDRDLFVREGGNERRLLAMKGFSNDGSKYAIDGIHVSPDGAHVAVGVSANGSEESVFYVIEVASGKRLSDRIERATWEYLRWAGPKTILYTQSRQGATGKDKATRASVKVHTLGEDAAKDRTVFGFGYSPALPFKDDHDYLVETGADSPWVAATVGQGGRECEVYVARAGDLAKKGEVPWQKVVSMRDEVTDVALRGDDLYLLTHKGASRFMVTRLALKGLKKDKAPPAEALVPEGEGVIQELVAAKDGLYLNVFEGSVSRLYRVPYAKSGKPAPIELPHPGTFRRMAGNAAEPGVVLLHRGWTKLGRTYGVDAGGAKVVDLGLEPPPTVDTSSITASFYSAKSADGTLVPLSVVHPKDISKDGKRPAWLDVYGSLGIINTPLFWPGRMAWFERGGVFAVCHARGGGERGEAWHRAGMREGRVKTMEDLVGCAHKLEEERLSSSRFIAAAGKSAGGLPVSMALVHHPDRFGAFLLDVGVVNALRWPVTPLGPALSAEFGAFDDEAGFRALLATDALSGVKDGVAYPPVLLTAGAQDPRVPAWMPAKMAARLQAASKGRTPLLRVDYESGHFAETRAAQNAFLADLFAFLLDALRE